MILFYLFDYFHGKNNQKYFENHIKRKYTRQYNKF